MTSDQSRAPARPRRQRLLWGYAPLVLGAAALVVAVAAVPSRVPEEVSSTSEAPIRKTPENRTASGWGTKVGACDDRQRQVRGDGYAPPCFEFTGKNNGGATTRGVTADTITVSFRLTAEPNVIGLLAEAAGMEFNETTEDLERTARGLLDYFNENYELYGRKLVLEGFQGRGSLLAEVIGSGQEAAANDALKVSDEIEAFADVTGLTQPYAEALARNEVISFGAPYMSREWFHKQRPYAWSPVPDCTSVAEIAAEYHVKHLRGTTAQHAGGSLAGRPRTIASIAPNNLEYQQCIDTAAAAIAESGDPLDLRLDYVLGIADTADQASALIAKLKANDITSIGYSGDPLMLMALAAEADSQDYHPEWLVIGVGFVDLDIAGQLISTAAPDQWKRAFGASPLPPLTIGQSEAYQAYKSVRDDEPSLVVDVIYQQLLPLAIGVQMAGPNLTPETFEAGLFAYPGGNGIAGRWKWNRGSYTPIVDFREVWWDPDATSPFNGSPGAYVDNGKRYRQGEIVEGEPEVFE